MPEAEPKKRESFPLDLPPMTSDEAELWATDALLPALAFYCKRTGVPSRIAWTHFVTSPPSPPDKA